MTKAELKEIFESQVLKGTCFDTLERFLEDRTAIDINAVRALIAVNLKGVWRGMTLLNDLLVKNSEIKKPERRSL